MQNTTLKAMLAEKCVHPAPYIKSTQWVMQQKMDGVRTIVEIIDGDCTFYSRDGEPQKPVTAVAASMPNIKSLVLDGEIVNNTYWVFDVLTVNSRNIEQLPFYQRRQILESLFEKVPFNSRVVLCEQWESTSTKKRVIRELFDSNAEGVMFKEKTRPYMQKRVPFMLKYKFYSTAVLQIMRTQFNGFERSAQLGAKNGSIIVDVGSCQIPERLVDKIKPGDTVKVRYLYATKNNRIYQPVFVRQVFNSQIDSLTSLKKTDKTVFTLQER